MKIINLSTKKQELEEKVQTYYGVDLENLYSDLKDCYREGGDELDERQKLYLLAALDFRSIQTVADWCKFKNKKTVTQECSRKLYKYLKILFNLNKDKRLAWDSINRLIREDGGYINQED